MMHDMMTFESNQSDLLTLQPQPQKCCRLTSKILERKRPVLGNGKTGGVPNAKLETNLVKKRTALFVARPELSLST